MRQRSRLSERSKRKKTPIRLDFSLKDEGGPRAPATEEGLLLVDLAQICEGRPGLQDPHLHIFPVLSVSIAPIVSERSSREAQSITSVRW